MSTATIALLATFDGLPDTDKQQFVNAVCRRVPPCDSGPLDDELVALPGDQLAVVLAAEEVEAQAIRRRDEIRSGKVKPVASSEVYRRIESVLSRDAPVSL